MHHQSMGSKARLEGRVACSAVMGDDEEPIDHIIEALEGLSNFGLVRVLSYIAAEISARAAAEQVAEDLSGAPWRLQKGKAKGKGKGRNHEGKGGRRRDGPY